MAITKAVWKFTFRKHSLRMAALMFCAFSAATAAAMDRGQFQNVPPEIREWFENMRSPKGISCCSYADGHRTGYDIRQGQYWVPIDGDWYPVPPEAVIKTENPVGEAIVWYLLQSPDSGLPHSELYKIICFVPSGDVRFHRPADFLLPSLPAALVFRRLGSPLYNRHLRSHL